MNRRSTSHILEAEIGDGHHPGARFAYHDQTINN